MPVPDTPSKVLSSKSNSSENQKTLVDILVEKGKLSPENAEEIKVNFINTGETIEKIISEQGVVLEEDLASAKGEFYKVPFANLTEMPSSPDALAKIPRVVAEGNNLVPIAYDKATNTLSVAMADPLNIESIEFVEKKAGARIKPYIASLSQIKASLIERYEAGLTTEVSQALKAAAPEIAPNVIDIKKLGLVIREAPIAKIVSTVLEFAMRSRASDIHLEPQEDRTRVRYRIDGILHEKLVLPKNVHNALVSRIKILAGMKIDEKRIPQDGRFSFRADENEVDLRVSSLPTVHGEKIVMRLLKKTGGVPELPELGLRGRALVNLQEAVARPHGIIIVCGPTGSGKTTTLYSAISKINTSRVNIVTLEDPVEYQIPGVNQVQVNPAAGLTFASGLRSFLRQDPNIIMVGEIRDNETADLAIQASLTGHLVFSTLHTNSASGSLPRLLDMHAEPFLLASSMTAIVGQRVCRRICPSCKQAYDASPLVIEDIKNVLGKLWPPVDGKVKIYKGKGCPDCNNTGFLGRIGIFEVLSVTEKIGRLILERSPAGTIEKQAVEEGMITMKQDGYLKVLEGVSTIEEVKRVAQD